MSYQRVWCVQTYRRQGRRLEPTSRHTFGRQGDALARGFFEARRAVATLVYEVEIDVAVNQVGRVIELARYGSVQEAGLDMNACMARS